MPTRHRCVPGLMGEIIVVGGHTKNQCHVIASWGLYYPLMFDKVPQCKGHGVLGKTMCSAQTRIPTS